MSVSVVADNEAGTGAGAGRPIRRTIVGAIRTLLEAEGVPEERIVLALDVLRRGERSAAANLSPEQVAEMLGVTRRTVNRMLESGRLKLTRRKLGHRTTRFAAREVAREMERLGLGV